MSYLDCLASKPIGDWSHWESADGVLGFPVHRRMVTYSSALFKRSRGTMKANSRMISFFTRVMER